MSDSGFATASAVEEKMAGIVTSPDSATGGALPDDPRAVAAASAAVDARPDDSLSDGPATDPVVAPDRPAAPRSDPEWETALARARWIARLGRRRRRPDGTREDWLEPAQRAELERRGRVRLAFYRAADAFAAREGRAPDKPEQRRLLAQVLTEEDAPQSRAAAALVRNGGDEATSWLRSDANLAKAASSDLPSPSQSPASSSSLASENASNQKPPALGRQGVSGAAQRRLNRLKWRDPLSARESNLRELVEDWRLLGRTRAADLLEKFLNQDDSVFVVSREEAREIDFVKNAEEINNSRFINSTFTGETANPDITAELRMLADNARVRIEDHYEKIRSSRDSEFRFLGGLVAEQVFGVDRTEEIDLALSYGGFHVRSDIVFYAERDGDEIAITGKITHNMVDTYDFDGRGPGAWLGAYDLQKAGRGTPFEIKGTWTQDVKGTIKILGSEFVERKGEMVREHVLGNPQFEIYDVDQ